MNLTYKNILNQNGFLKVNNLFSYYEINNLLIPIKNIIEKYSKDFTDGDFRRKTNLLFKETFDLVKTSSLTSLITELLGNSYMCYDMMIWVKKPESIKSNFVSMHQDGTYWNIEHPINGLIVWIPLMDISTEQGPIRYVPESHKNGILKHFDIPTEHNLLRRGQTIIDYLNKESVTIPCKLGDVTIHTPYTVHSSDINYSNENRLALSIQYISSNSRLKLKNSVEIVQHINGEKNFSLEYIDFLSENYKENLSFWRNALNLQHNNYYKL